MEEAKAEAETRGGGGVVGSCKTGTGDTGEEKHSAGWNCSMGCSLDTTYPRLGRDGAVG